VSGGQAHRTAFSFGRVGQTGADIFAGQLAELADDLFLGHAGGQVRQHVAHRDARSAHERLAKANTLVNRDAFEGRHGCRVRQ
jgi:hypothetical protein